MSLAWTAEVLRKGTPLRENWTWRRGRARVRFLFMVGGLGGWVCDGGGVFLFFFFGVYVLMGGIGVED